MLSFATVEQPENPEKPCPCCGGRYRDTYVLPLEGADAVHRAWERCTDCGLWYSPATGRWYNDPDTWDLYEGEDAR